MKAALTLQCSGSGRITSLVFADHLWVNDPVGPELWRRYCALIGALAKNAHPHLHVHVFIGRFFPDQGRQLMLDIEATRKFFSEEIAQFGYDPLLQLNLVAPGNDGATDWDTFQDQGNETVWRLPEQRKGLGTCWIQDCCMVLEDGEGKPVLLAPQRPWVKFKSDAPNAEPLPVDVAVANMEVPMHLARSCGFQLSTTDLLFEGGNVLLVGGAQVALVGSDVLRTNWRVFGDRFPNFHDLTKALASAFRATHLLCPGIKSPPTHWSQIPEQPDLFRHLDLCVTVCGTLPDGSGLLLVGDLVEWTQSADGSHAWLPSAAPLKGYLDNMVKWFRDVESLPNRPARFTVCRVPMLWHEGVVLSYNNCLVESYGAVRNAYVPGYGDWSGATDDRFLKADERAVMQFKAAGIEPVMVLANYLPLAQSSGGSLHCLTKVLTRNPLP